MSDNLADNAPATENAPDSGVQTFNFTQALAPEFRDNPSLSKFGGDVNKLVKSNLELESYLGGERIPVPKDEKDETAWGFYRKAFGVPDKPEGYELPPVDGYDATELRQFARSLNLNNKQAAALQERYLGEMRRMTAEHTQKLEADKLEAVNSLKKEWGVKFEENIANARNAIKKLAGDEGFARLEQKYGNDPDFIKAFSKAGELLSESSLGGFEGQVNGFAKTPSEAQAELQKIMDDPNNPYWTGVKNYRNNPTWAREHNVTYVSEQDRLAAVERYKKLVEMAG